jgi:hypothetical protein
VFRKLRRPKKQRTRKQKIRSAVLTTLSTIVALALSGAVAHVWLDREAAEAWRRADRGWTGVLGFGPDDVVARFPKCEKNEAARRIDAFVDRLDLASTTAPVHWAEFVSDAMIESEGDRLGELPHEARAFLDRHAPELDAFYREVLAGEDPCWDLDISLLTEAPVPNARAASVLTGAIAADALYRASQGRHEDARLAVEAAWKINSAYRTRPDVVSQLIASSGDGVIVCVLRKLSGLGPEWRDRIVAGDRRQALYVAMGVESWAVVREIEAARDFERLTTLRPDVRSGAERQWDGVGAVALRPFLRYCAVTLSEEEYVRAEGLGASWPGTVFSARLPTEPAWWNPLARDPLNVSLAQGMVGKYLLLADATRAILTAKQLRQDGSGRQRIDSTVFTGAGWQFDPLEGEGAFTLVFTRPEQLDDIRWMQRYRTIAWS